MLYYIQMKAKSAPQPKYVQVEIPVPLLPGSVSTAWIQCGKPNCACHQDSQKRHGIYYRWTGILAGKRTTKAVSQAEAKVCEEMIKNYRQALKKIGELVEQSLPEAPWEKRSVETEDHR